MTDESSPYLRVVFTDKYDTSEVSPASMAESIRKVFYNGCDVSLKDSFYDDKQLSVAVYSLDGSVTAEELRKCRDILRLETGAYDTTVVVA